MPEEEVETEEVVEPEEEVAEVPEVQPVDVEEAEAEMVVAEEEAPAEEKPVVEEEVPEEKPPVEEEAVAEEAAPPEEALPNIFVSDCSTPPRSLTGARTLVVVDEKKAYPMNNAVNAWVREHDIPIKAPTPELGAKIKELGIEGLTKLPDLAELTKKLEA